VHAEDRLGRERVRARTTRRLFVVVRRDHDERQTLTVWQLPRPLDEYQPVNERQVMVNDEQVVMSLAFNLPQPRQTVSTHFDPPTLAGEQIANDARDHLIIFDVKNREAHRGLVAGAARPCPHQDGQALIRPRPRPPTPRPS
ncbi:MAG: hypothetical protein QOH63_2542, partial [Acidobacteriota bacterium]|nr:hypothetical protein [Acidobacteriota bacterium]